MINLGFVFIVAFMQVVISQGPPPPPPQCRGPPKVGVRPHDCCKLPKLFKDEDFAECGFKKMEDGDPPKVPPKGPPPHHDCTKQECVMKKYNIIKEDGIIDLEAVNSLLDKMVEKNAEFKDAVVAAKAECTSGKPLPGPPHICEPDKLLHCVSSVLFENCPNWDGSDGCKTLKNLMVECKPFFIRP